MGSVSRSRYAVIFALFLIAAAVGTWTSRYKNQPPILAEISFPPFHKVYFIPNPNATQLEVQLIVQSGEADLTSIEGQAHYVEHLAWLSAVGSQVRLADRHTNAWTTSDATGYWMTGNPAELPGLLTTIVKTLETPKLDQKFAEAERGIILREYDLRVRGNNYAKIEDALDKAIYEGTPYARSVGGVPSDIEKYSVENALAIHAQTHVPSNAVLVISGPISKSEITEALSELDFEQKSEVQVKVPAPLFVAYKTEDSSEQVEIGKFDLAPELIWRKIIRLTKSVSIDVLEARTALLHDVLDTNLPGGLAKPLRYDAFIAESYALDITALDEQFIEVRFSARPDKGISLDQLRAAFEKTLKDSAGAGIPGTTFDRVLGRFTTYWPDWDDPEKVANWMKNYTLDRASDRRVPLPADDVRKINTQLNLVSNNELLKALAGPGRVRFVEIGEQP